MPFDLLFIACHTLFKLGIEIKIIIVIIQMSDTYRNQKLYAEFFAAFVTVFVVLTKLLHCLEIKLFINEGGYITFKFPAVQKHSFRIIAYTKYFTSKQPKNTPKNKPKHTKYCLNTKVYIKVPQELKLPAVGAPGHNAYA